MKSINIKGKNYIMVNERIKAFRETFKGYSLLSEIVELTENACTIKASILNEKREIVATGFAREVVGKTPINKFAFVENAETSAWGRALGNFGIGIDDAICTAEELTYKLAQDNAPANAPAEPANAPATKPAPQKTTTLSEEEKAKINACTEIDELGLLCSQLKAKHPQNYAELIKLYNEKVKDLQLKEKTKKVSKK